MRACELGTKPGNKFLRCRRTWGWGQGFIFSPCKILLGNSLTMTFCKTWNRILYKMEIFLSSIWYIFIWANKWGDWSMFNALMWLAKWHLICQKLMCRAHYLLGEKPWPHLSDLYYMLYSLDCFYWLVKLGFHGLLRSGPDLPFHFISLFSFIYFLSSVWIKCSPNPPMLLLPPALPFLLRSSLPSSLPCPLSSACPCPFHPQGPAEVLPSGFPQTYLICISFCPHETVNFLRASFVPD